MLVHLFYHWHFEVRLLIIILIIFRALIC